MKKILCVLLVTALLLCGAFMSYAIAEGGEAAPVSAPLIDLTGLAIALLVAAFEFLMARFARVLIPPAKSWLEAHTTEKERGLLWNVVCELVNAAEQIIQGPNMGARRKAYVVAGLRQRGLTVDIDMIEAAVKDMNERMKLRAGSIFNIEQEETTTREIEADGKTIVPLDLDANGEPDVEIEHWSLAQLRSFCALNNIFAEGCTTREDYIEAIVRGAKPVEECVGKDYCELDFGAASESSIQPFAVSGYAGNLESQRDSNLGDAPEEPQSVNE